MRALGVALLVLVGAWGILAWGRSGATPAVGYVAAVIPLEAAPSAGLTASKTAIWIPSDSDGALSRLDPDTNQIAATIRVGAAPTCALCWGAVAADDRDVWTTSRSARLAVVQIDPLQNRETASLPLSVFPSAVALSDDGTLWVASVLDSAVLRFDPTTHLQVAAIAVPRASRLAVDDTATWVLTQPDGSAHGYVARIDTRTNQVVATIEVGSQPTALAVGEGSVWVVDEGTQRLLRIDPGSNSVVATIAVGFLPTGVVAGSGSVWVISQSAPANQGPALSRVDPTTDTVTGSVALGEGSPVGLAVGSGSVWIASRDPNTIVRVEPLSSIPRSARDWPPGSGLALAAVLLLVPVLVGLVSFGRAGHRPTSPAHRPTGLHSDLRRFARTRASALPQSRPLPPGEAADPH